jgi:hypothetical protein
VKRRSRRSIPEYLFERTLTFDPTVGSLKIIEEFPDAGFPGVDVESLLGDAEVSSLQTRVPVGNGHNF